MWCRVYLEMQGVGCTVYLESVQRRGRPRVSHADHNLYGRAQRVKYYMARDLNEKLSSKNVNHTASPLLVILKKSGSKPSTRIGISTHGLMMQG